MTTVQDMFAAVDAAAQDHFEWCTAHDYENEIDPEVQLCRSVLAVDVTSEDRDDVSAISVQLTGSHADEAYGFPIPQAAIALNGRPADFEMAPWKLVPTAYMLLAAHARAEGDEDRARAFLDAANVAITEHHEVEIEAERVRDAGLHLDGSLFDGPFNYVMVGHPDGGVITYDQYEVEQSLAAGIPQWVVQHAEDGLRYQVVGALDSEPVDGETYSEFADAKTARDRLNEKARADAAAATQSPSPRTVVEADCGHYMVVADGESVDGEHYTDQDAAQAAAEILTAEQLEALPLHAEVTDNKGVEWKKFFGGGWSFRCLGGHNRDQQSSEFLAQYAPRLLQRAGGAR